MEKNRRLGPTHWKGCLPSFHFSACRTLKYRRTAMVKHRATRDRVETTLMMLSWNRDSSPTTRPVNTMPVRSMSRQYIRSVTAGTEREGEREVEVRAEEKWRVVGVMEDSVRPTLQKCGKASG